MGTSRETSNGSSKKSSNMGLGKNIRDVAHTQVDNKIDNLWNQIVNQSSHQMRKQVRTKTFIQVWIQKNQVHTQVL